MMVNLKQPQWQVFNCDARFRVLVAGRRFGKTYLATVELCQAAWKQGRLAWYVAPTYKQAKRIAWGPLKLMTRPYWAKLPNETDLRIELTSGGTICLRGADNYDSLRGDGIDFLVLDEYASMAPEAWSEVLRPALADRRGRPLFIGTPRGHNHFYDLYHDVQGWSEWRTFQFTTEEGGNVSSQELRSATQQLDERTYRQEFQASFESIDTGIVYYAFDRSANVAPVEYNWKLPLVWSLDFNVNPMCSVIGQRDGNHVYVLDEIVLPDSNTEAALETFMERTRPYVRVSSLPMQLNIYGDSTGDSRRSAASRTDWQTVKDYRERHRSTFNTSYRVARQNPPVKDRVNCTNAKLRNGAGERQLRIDPRCKQLIKDFERVHWKVDPSGNTLAEIDKGDPERTHTSDALGYMIAKEFTMRPAAGYMQGIVQ
jgi:terminase large subunit-like protein